jgi:hypothetical protein
MSNLGGRERKVNNNKPNSKVGFSFWREHRLQRPRINLEFTMQFFIRSSSASSEWVMVEIQGDLESRVGDLAIESKFVGDLHYTM